MLSWLSLFFYKSIQSRTESSRTSVKSFNFLLSYQDMTRKDDIFLFSRVLKVGKSMTFLLCLICSPNKERNYCLYLGSNVFVPPLVCNQTFICAKQHSFISLIWSWNVDALNSHRWMNLSRVLRSVRIVRRCSLGSCFCYPAVAIWERGKLYPFLLNSSCGTPQHA